MEDKDVMPLIERMDYLVNRVSIDFHRYLFNKIKWRNRLVGIKGGRGTGKTTLLRQHIRETFGGVGAKRASWALVNWDGVAKGHVPSGQDISRQHQPDVCAFGRGKFRVPTRDILLEPASFGRA